MSYDLDLFTPHPDQDAITIIQQAALHPASARTLLNDRIAQALINLYPQLQTMTSAQRVEIFDAKEGIRISLYTHTGHIAVPYWFRDEHDIRRIFGHLRQYLRSVQDVSGYQIYDPQFGKVVDLEYDFDRMLDMYRRTSLAMQSFFGEA